MKNTIISMAIAVFIIFISYKLAHSFVGCPTENKRVAIELVYETDLEIAMNVAITEGIQMLKDLGYEKIELLAYAVYLESKTLIVILEGRVEKEARSGTLQGLHGLWTALWVQGEQSKGMG